MKNTCRTRGTFFLALIGAFGLLEMAVGLWEWLISDSLHNLAAGTCMLLLTLLAYWLARRHVKRAGLAVSKDES